jgi:hypothetical protein
MSFGAVFLALGVAACLHNLEEWRGYEEFAHTYHGRLNVRLRDRRVFGFALILLNAAVLILGVVEFVGGPGWTTTCSRIVVFAFLVNALEHCARSLITRKLVPGSISALLLIIPLALIAIHVMRRDYGDTGATLILSFLGSLVVMPIAIFSGLWSGFLANRLLTAIQRGAAPLDRGRRPRRPSLL